MSEFFKGVSEWITRVRMYKTGTVTTYVPVEMYQKIKSDHRFFNTRTGLNLKFSEWMAVAIREGMKQISAELSKIENPAE